MHRDSVLLHAVVRDGRGPQALLDGEGSLGACIVDATHGGMVLGEEMERRGFDVTVIDVYGTVDAVEREGFGFRIVDRGFGRYDVLAVPVHCGVDPGPVEGTLRVDHHDLAGALASGYKDGVAFEVTGVRGKTTVATYLARILEEAGWPVKLSTTDTCPVGSPSVAPYKVLEVMRATSGPYVIEVSLGVTPAADVAVLSGVPYDYRVAGGTRSAVAVKARKIAESGALPVLERGDVSRLPPLPGAVLVETGEGRVSWRGGSVEFEPFGVPFHDRSFGLAAVAALESGLAGVEDVLAARSRGFVPGRLELVGEDVLVDVHPAVNERTLRHALDVASRLWGRYGLVFGGDPGGYCEGIDVDEAVEEILRRIESYELVGLELVGGLGELVEDRLPVRPSPAPDGYPVVVVLRSDRDGEVFKRVVRRVRGGSEDGGGSA